MDPKEKSGTPWSKKPPSEKLEILRNLRDKKHTLRSKNRPYDQDWFIEEVLNNNLTQTYINDISVNDRT